MTQRRIYSYISRTAIISLLLLLATTATARKKPTAKSKTDTTVKADSIPLLRGVAVSADMIGLAETILGSHGQYEAQLRVNLKDKFFPVVEVGYGTADANRAEIQNLGTLCTCGNGLQHSAQQARRLPHIRRSTLRHDLL